MAGSVGLRRIGLGVLALAAAALVIEPIWLVATTHAPIEPLETTAELWNAWLLSWLIAAIWSRPATATPALRDQVIHWTPTIVGFLLLAEGSAFQFEGPLHIINTSMLWQASFPVQWALAGVCAAGLAFTWWARITLGSLWSGSVSRKEDHTVVSAGPYRLVRHPIYTGIILAAFAMAIEIGMAINLIGACLMTYGLWLKARLEERFLSAELGEAAYADYRRTTPMLIPFWPSFGAIGR
jgi:protein-S-isoprenylcysteine O-methyltransferase Ste14